MQNRRKFIKQSTALTGAVVGASFVGCKSDLSSQKESTAKQSKLIIGHGDFKYRLDKEWGIPSSGQYPVHHCHEMVMDKSGRLIMTTTDIRNNILVYNKDGNILDAWTGEWPSCHGLSINDEGGDSL